MPEPASSRKPATAAVSRTASNVQLTSKVDGPSAANRQASLVGTLASNAHALSEAHNDDATSDGRSRQDEHGDVTAEATDSVRRRAEALGELDLKELLGVLSAASEDTEHHTRLAAPLITSAQIAANRAPHDDMEKLHDK